MAAPAADPTQWPEHIRARYGVSERSRWRPVLLAGLGIAFAAAVTVVGWRIANPPIDSGLTAYDIVADDHVAITFEVQRTESSPASCTVRARAEDGFDVGYAVVALPPAEGLTTHSYDLRTAYRALIGELLGCGIDGPPAGVPPAQYRPGAVPPTQPWMPAGS
jgi:hypothetical protein